MFGTIARVTVQPGKEQEFVETVRQWSQTRGASTGEVAAYTFQLEGREREYLAVSIFADRETYYANANDPETNQWYRRMRAAIEADPEWNDGEVVAAQVYNGI